MPRPGFFTPWKETWYPLYRRLSGPHDLSRWVRKNMPPVQVSDPQTFQLVAKSNTYLAMPAHRSRIKNTKLSN
jgi:hypothetical protein